MERFVDDERERVRDRGAADAERDDVSGDVVDGDVDGELDGERGSGVVHGGGDVGRRGHVGDGAHGE
jgi:hypothetical protein